MFGRTAEQYAALENSRILKHVDDQPVWFVVCFYVAKAARIVEGYPIDMQTPKLAGQKLTSYAGYMGVASVFRDVGFVEVGRASETQLIMRYTLGR